MPLPGITRNVFNSLFYHLENLLISGGYINSANAGSLTFLDAYPAEDRIKRLTTLDNFLEISSGDPRRENLTPLPVMSMETTNFREIGYQIGSTGKERKSQVIVSVFSDTDIQADFLVDFVVSGLTKNNLILYDYSTGFTGLSSLGKIFIDDNYNMVARYETGSNSIFVRTADLIFTVTTYN